MKKTSTAKTILGMILIIAAGAAVFFCNHAAGVVNIRRAQNTRLVELAGAFLKQNENSVAELNEDMKALEKKTVHDGYDAFSGRSAERIAENGRDINEIVNSHADTEPARRLKSALIRYAAKANSIEYTMKYCAESLLFSYGAPKSDTCYGISTRLIFRDVKQLGEEVRDSRKYLVSHNGWRSVYTMPPAKIAAAKSDKVNVIFILVDTLRGDMLGATDGGKPVSPELDALARGGVNYIDATAGAPGTYTAVSSIFTGCDPLESNAARISKWNYKSSLIAQFKKAGYDTIGYSANSLISEENNFDYGFNFFRDRFWPPSVVIMNEVETRLLAERPSSPFFLYVQLIDPHVPYFSPDDVQNIANNGRPEGYVLNPAHLRDEAKKRGAGWVSETRPANVEYLKSLYIKEVSYTDKWIGNLLDFLKEKGMLENTLVVVTADHGEQFYEHGDMEHAKYLWRELTHVPLILSGKLPPGLSPGQVVSVPHSTMEILPSILKWQGVALEGTPARRAVLFDAKAKRSPAPLVSISPCCELDSLGKNAEIISLRNGKYKIIMETDSRKMRLFDLSADPGEKNDISRSKPGVAAAMSKQALRTMEESIRARIKAGSKSAPSPELQKQLKSLGYIK